MELHELCRGITRAIMSNYVSKIYIPMMISTCSKHSDRSGMLLEVTFHNNFQVIFEIIDEQVIFEIMSWNYLHVIYHKIHDRMLRIIFCELKYPDGLGLAEIFEEALL